MGGCRVKKDEFPDLFMSVGRKEEEKTVLLRTRRTFVTEVVQPFPPKLDIFQLLYD